MNLSQLINGGDDYRELKVRKQYEQFGDDPDNLRWRAWWDKNYDGKVLGIKLECYPVVRQTPCGAWINPVAWIYHRYDETGVEVGHGWSEPSKQLLRWVGNESGQAWAKKTQQAAIDSLLYRFQRWGRRMGQDLGYFLAVAHALGEIYPDKKAMAERVLSENIRWRFEERRHEPMA